MVTLTKCKIVDIPPREIPSKNNPNQKFIFGKFVTEYGDVIPNLSGKGSPDLHIIRGNLSDVAEKGLIGAVVSVDIYSTGETHPWGEEYGKVGDLRELDENGAYKTVGVDKNIKVLDFEIASISYMQDMQDAVEKMQSFKDDGGYDKWQAFKEDLDTLFTFGKKPKSHKNPW